MLSLRSILRGTDTQFGEPAATHAGSFRTEVPQDDCIFGSYLK
jgi:hypothetical protein